MRLTQKEIRSVSIAATIERLHNGEPVSGLLREVNEQLEKDGGRAFDPMRPIVPWQMLQTRDLIVATPASGGYLVGTDATAAADTLRPYSVVLANGAQTLENLSSSVVLPSITGSASGGWLSSEAATQSPSDATFSASTLSPKSYAALMSISRSLRLAATQADPVIRTHLSRLCGFGIDQGVLNGSGASGQPTGLLNVSGTQSQSGTTLAEAGVCNALEQSVTNGSDDRRVVFVSTAPVRELLQTRESVTGSGVYVWRNNELAGKPAFATTAMPAATMLCGDFANVVIGFFGPGIELMADPFTAFKTGVVTVRAIVSVDVGVLFPAAFCKSTSIT